MNIIQIAGAMFGERDPRDGLVKLVGFTMNGDSWIYHKRLTEENAHDFCSWVERYGIDDIYWKKEVRNA